MQRCWLKGSEGDALYAVLCAADYNLLWLLRATARKGLKAFFVPVLWLAMGLTWLSSVPDRTPNLAAMAKNEFCKADDFAHQKAEA